MKRIALVLLLFADTALAANARGLAVNVPLVGRLTGAGNTLFTTAIDVSNHAGVPAQVDFYLDGVESSTGMPIVADGSISGTGQLVARGSGTPMRARSNAHFDDFVDALVQAGLLAANVKSTGFLGSVLFVFDGFHRAGQGSATARFYNAFGGGFVGVSVRGREMTSNEPQSLVATVLDTRGVASGAPQIYPNLFINNTGATPTGAGIAGPVTVEISAISNTTGQSIGTPFTISDLGPGRVASVGSVLTALRIPQGSETTVLVFARVVSGSAAIHGLVSQVDNVTRDGAVFEMVRADF